MSAFELFKVRGSFGGLKEQGRLWQKFKRVRFELFAGLKLQNERV